MNINMTCNTVHASNPKIERYSSLKTPNQLSDSKGSENITTFSDVRSDIVRPPNSSDSSRK